MAAAPTREQLDRLYRRQHRDDIPHGDRGWFWTNFKALKASGWHYDKAWHYTVLALEHHHRGLTNTG